MIFRALFPSRTTVLVVCTANVCRSPVAAAALRRELGARGVAKYYRVKSAGTHVGSIGQRPDPRMVALARAAGISLRGERATRLTTGLLEEASLLVAMEQRHLDTARALEAMRLPDAHLLGEWGPDSAGDGSRELPDPYFASRAAVQQVFDRILQCTASLAADLERRIPDVAGKTGP